MPLKPVERRACSSVDLVDLARDGGLADLDEAGEVAEIDERERGLGAGLTDEARSREEPVVGLAAPELCFVARGNLGGVGVLGELLRLANKEEANDGNGRSSTIEGPRLRVCVCRREFERAEDPGNRLRLNVWRKHYSRLARRVLELPPSEWVRINAARNEDSLIYLGPTIFDDLKQRPTSWRIQRVPLGEAEELSDGSSSRSFKDNAELILDLGEVPGELRPRDPFERNERLVALPGHSLRGRPCKPPC